MDSVVELRLQVALARAGIASRRQAAVIIQEGRVTVNGSVTLHPGLSVCFSRDEISVDGQKLPLPENHQYFALYKPRGVLSTVKDDRGRPTVAEFLPRSSGRCVPVGRLDLDSEGLLLLTNDGKAIDGLLHPRFGIPRVYLVEVGGIPTDADLQDLRDGFSLNNKMTSLSTVKRSNRPGRTLSRQSLKTSWLVVTIFQGRKREIRLKCDAIGYRVQRLIRVKFGPILLRDLPVGKIRELTSHEVMLLQKAANKSLTSPYNLHDD